MIIVTAIILLVYSWYLWIHYRTIIFEDTEITPANESALSISIIIPFRNEAQHLPKLLRSLENQSYEQLSAEIIFVDDHSEDDGPEIIRNHIPLISVPCRIEKLPNNLSGKKAALQHGIDLCQYEIIINTDADCRAESTWLASMTSGFIEKKADLLSGPVRLETSRSWIEQFQLTEWMAIAGLTLSGYVRNTPFSSNAANIMYRKSLYLAYRQQDKHQYIASGDDIFLLHYALKNNYSCQYMASKKAIVSTPAVRNPLSFLQQRIRWAGKSSSVHNLDYLSGLMIILLGNACLLYWYVTVFISSMQLIWLLVFFAIKWLVDILFIRKMMRFYNQKVGLGVSLLTALVYPVYIWITGVLSLIVKPTWKTRKT